MIYTNLDRELCRNNDLTLAKINNNQNKNMEQLSNVLGYYKELKTIKR